MLHTAAEEIPKTALVCIGDQLADEMQLDCISETLMEAILLFPGALPHWCLSVGSHGPLDSSYTSLFKAAGGVRAFMCFNDERVGRKSETKLIPLLFDARGCL